MTLVRMNNRYHAPAKRYYNWDSLLNNWMNEWDGASGTSQVPAANIIEQDKSFVIELAIPGYDKEQVRITVENNVLTVSHEQEEKDVQSEQSRFVRREFGTGEFARKFRLSRWVDSENVSAQFSNGVLKITVPKKEEAIAKPAREIKIS